MWCPVLSIGARSRASCAEAMAKGVPACCECEGASLQESYPDPVPPCPCGREGNHKGACSARDQVQNAGRPPTIREMGYVSALMEGATPKQAVSAANSLPVPEPPVSKRGLERSEAVRTLVEQALDDAGVDMASCARVIRDGLDATKSEIRVGKDSVLVDRQEPDHTTRLSAAKMALELRNAFPNAKSLGPGQGGNIVIVNSFSRIDQAQAPSGEKDVTRD